MKTHVEEQQRRLLDPWLASASESTTQESSAPYEISRKPGYKHQKKKAGGFRVRSRRIAVTAVYKRYGLAGLVSVYFLSHQLRAGFNRCESKPKQTGSGHIRH